MLHIPLDDLTEQHLAQLQRDEVPESLRLEYKSQLDLSQTAHKREVSKDVSAMANTAGGRIIYGQDEVEQSGHTVAGSITPLSDGGLDESLENIIVTTIHPPPRYRIKRVTVSGGLALVVEIYPSSGLDLHMATGYGEGRFYRRGERRTIRMTEPEIREAYSRIAASTAALEKTIEETIESEIAIRRNAQESVLVVPWFARPNMADPRLLRDIGEELVEGPFRRVRDRDFRGLLRSITPFSGGLRLLYPPDERSRPSGAHFYLTLLRNGSTHLSRKVVTKDQPLRYFPLDTVLMLLTALEVSSLILNRVNYWGPIRLIHRLALQERAEITPNAGPAESLENGVYTSTVSQFNLREQGHDLEPLAGEILDQIFQAAGAVRCPWFAESGQLNEPYATELGLRASSLSSPFARRA